MRLLKSMEWLQLTYDSPGVQSRELDEWLTKFFTNFRTSNGSWKTTSRSRHAEMDEALIAVLKRKGLRPQVVMDIGVASGATTVDLKRALDRHGFSARIIATDRTLRCYVARLHRELDVLFEADGHILKIEIFGVDFSPWCSARDYLSGLALLKGGVSRYIAWRLNGAWPPFRVDGPYSMITPELKGRPDVTIIEDDILSPTPPELIGSADVIRLAHVVRPDRFSEDDIRRIVGNVRRRCRDGAVVIVCRSNPRARVRGALEGSIFQAVPGGGFEIEDRIGPGSEVERYFLAEGVR